jgi:hypothetical protein
VKIQSPLAHGDLHPFRFCLGNFIAAITKMSMGRSWLPCLMMTGQAQEDPTRMLMLSREDIRKYSQRVRRIMCVG